MELFLASLGDLVGILWEVGRKMREAGAKMAASRAPDGPYWRLDGHLEVNLWVWEHLDPILVDSGRVLGGLAEDFGDILVHGWNLKNLWFSFGFLWFWRL